MTTLREALAGWADYDGALFKLAVCLGLIDPAVDFAGLGKSIWAPPARPAAAAAGYAARGRHRADER